MPQLALAREVFIVDDDPTVHDVLSVAFNVEGIRVVSFVDGTSFLAAANYQNPACVLLDINMPGRSGLDILREIGAPEYPAPILMISCRNDIPVVVSAIKSGAFDFIEKPFAIETVMDRVHAAINVGVARGNGNDPGQRHFPGYELLTPREREVLAQITSGASNKEAGRNLGISMRTVEVHRAHIMHKLKARNAADLVRIVLGNGHSH
ncbi:MAG TPA: response regulator [Xanthobacteraceae bacterium]|nr:response regulator [Xanthobacteraceae bacterium]